MKTAQNFNISDIEINNDKALLDTGLIVRYLQKESYWATGRSEKVIIRSMKASICWGVYLTGRQIGFARAVTDSATVFYLADIFILPEFQNHGIGKILMQKILEHPSLSGLRGILTTQTAHRFYEEFGFGRDNDVAKRRIMILENNAR